jgi:parallel beta-helix repeat protein/predicted outer membrane repeat protein
LNTLKEDLPVKKKRIYLKLLETALCMIFGAAIIMLGLLSAYVPLAGAVDIHVPGDYSSIQTAIDAANDGDVVVAEADTYHERINFLGKAITVKSTDPNDPAVVAATIIDGSTAGSAVTFNHGEGSGCVLSGVTVQGGSASYGGGISCTSSSPVITHCTVSGNSASYGGGIYCTSSSPVITHCTVSGNSAPRGGGIYCDSSSLPTFTECAVSGNSASSFGGGIYCASSLAITHCTISANLVTSSSGGGGGIYCASFSSVITEPAIKNCIVSENSARNGGGMYCYSSLPKVTNCLMARNVAASSGGGVYSTNSSPVMTNCTLAGNSASSSKGGGAYVYSGSLTATNCILWSDSSGEINGNGSATVTCCDIRGGYAGTGASNIISDTPLFVNPDEGNYRLGSDSPCIDAGTGSNAPDADIDGKPRPMGTGYDMGAYEYDGPLLHEPSEVHVYSGQSIQAAISTAWKADVIIVHEGTYNERINFAGKAVTIKSTAPDDPVVVAATVIDGGSAGSVVVFSSGEKSDSVLSGFTIKNGKAVSGGGIYCANISSPTISNCTITGNAATSYGGGIYCYSSASPGISNCSLKGNSAPEGGGIYCDNSSLPTITKCAVNGNSASSGGGIYCTSSSPDIINCMISGNSATYHGGGIYCTYSSSSPVITHCMMSENSAGNGGGIYCTSSSSPEVTNCLLARNAASSTGGGVYSYNSSPAMTNCTLAGNSASPSNGGGAYVYSGSPTITNCILWSDSPGEISGNGSALVTYCDVRGGYTDTGDISDSPSFVDPAAGNYRLRPDSPCIDKGTGSNAPATDIDGSPRPRGTENDIGAYEYDGSLLHEPSEVHVYSGQSIQSAINAAYAGDRIIVHEGTYNENINFLGRAITVRSIDPNDPAVVAATVIDGGSAGSVVIFSSGEKSDSVLSGFTIKNGVAFSGGGIYCANISSPTISNCTITGNTATSYGGGICCYYSDLSISNCSLKGNSALNGGGLYYDSSSLPTLAECTVSANSASSDGGGIYCTSSSPAITHCTVSGNSASSNGGGIYCTSSSTVITHCMVSGNLAGNGGGIFCSSSSSPKVTNCLINRNISSDTGGGIYSDCSSPVMTNCTLAGNSASPSNGGGAYVYSGSPIITNCILWSDSPGEISGNGSAAITYCDIRGGYTGAGNISDSPSFVNPDAGNYRLRADSPCIDKGGSNAPATDLDGNPRPTGEGYDMGAYELFDVIPPQPRCKDITMQLDAEGQTTITADQIDNGSSDNQGIESLTVSPCTFTCADAGSNPVTLTVTDLSGNTNTCLASVRVEDNAKPIARCKDITVQLDAEGKAAITADQIDNGSSDNCSIASMTVSPSSFSRTDVGNNNVVFTVTDVSGNTDTCTAGVRVEDNAKPIARCKDITVRLDAAGRATITADQIDDGSSDNQGIDSLAVSPCTFTCADAGSNPVTLTVTDLSGNTDTCIASVRVEDNAKPIARCKDITVQLDAEGKATITADQIDNGSSDNCSIASMTVSPSSFSRTDVGNNNVVLTLTDVSGNTAHCSATVEVKEVPVLIELEQFTAAAASQGDRIILTWTTLSEIDNAGFNLWRSEAEEGEYIRINPRTIAAEGGSTLGAEYACTDYTAQPATVYFYRLENIDTSGASIFYGPVSAAIPVR